MLIPASAVGVLCFLYGFFTLVGDAHSKDVCENHKDIILCPRCDIKGCKYEQLGQTCTFVRITHLFDNGAAVFFDVFMSLWAVIFMELWKRYSAKITHHWDVTNFDTLEEHPRPEYLAKLSTVKKKKVNFITGVNEPCVSFWKRRVPHTIFSWSVVLLLVTIAIAAVVGVIVYRISIQTVLYFTLSDNQTLTSMVSLTTSVTAALLNLVCIMTFNLIYRRIATFLTELEIHRTQSDYENSLILKMYMLKFVISFLHFLSSNIKCTVQLINVSVICSPSPVLQFGFVTIFVVAFPLAPLFALLIITEIRLDARKFITFLRRPVAERVKNIGIWYRILNSVGKISVITNALIIAFTSSFIEETFYKVFISPDGSLNGFLNFTLSDFNISDFPGDLNILSEPDTSVEYCKYQDHREPPTANNKYEYKSIYWQFATTCLMFVFNFTCLVFIISSWICWLIPDIPKSVNLQIRHENHVINDMIIEHELRKAKYLALNEKKKKKEPGWKIQVSRPKVSL
ncbi:anoctamin-1-like [Tachypleus tridentatus]|uniref:anoctamin-1-like n=1 Tax=Tachypleus tridentatus TaxID=6853 RepID=UPI003FD5FD48